MARAIDADALMKKYGLDNAAKYGNKTAEEQAFSYDTMFMYEIADMIEDAPTIEPKPKWISVKDRLPKEHGEYIIHVENLTGFHALDRNVFEATYAFGQWLFDGCSDNRVTHWMPLPEPPEKEEK